MNPIRSDSRSPLDRRAFPRPNAHAAEVHLPSSPVMWDGLAILQVDTHDDSFLVARSDETGKQVWKTERDEIPSWSTPTVVTHPSGAELVVNGANFARGYDPRTGTERWRVVSGSPLATPTPIGAGGLSIITSGGMGSSRPIPAVRHGAQGVLAPADPAGTAERPSGLAWRDVPPYRDQRHPRADHGHARAVAGCPVRPHDAQRVGHWAHGDALIAVARASHLAWWPARITLASSGA